MIPLECLQQNETAEVADVSGDPRWVARMADMGVRPGVKVKMLCPGAPCIFEMGTCQVCLRTEDSVCVFVNPEPK